MFSFSHLFCQIGYAIYYLKFHNQHDWNLVLTIAVAALKILLGLAAIAGVICQMKPVILSLPNCFKLLLVCILLGFLFSVSFRERTSKNVKKIRRRKT